jgi:hypothetical protein
MKQMIQPTQFLTSLIFLLWAIPLFAQLSEPTGLD